MTVLPLFDRIAAANESGTRNSRDQDGGIRLIAVAQSMVAIANQQFREIRALDETLGSAGGANELRDIETARAIRRIFEEAASEAERVLDRVDALELKHKCVVPDAEELRDWHGRTMAMLSVSLEAIERGLGQALRGEVVSAAELRNELLSRLHQ